MKKKAHRPVGRKQTGRKVQLEYQHLENRQLLAGISFDPAIGIVTFEGTEMADSVRITNDASQLRVTWFGVDVQSFGLSQVNEVVFRGGNGDDWFRNDSIVSSRAYGQSGNDSLIGGSSRDVLNGGPNDDYLKGNGGNDVVVGWTGNDRAFGGSGDDRIDGGDGNDRIFGESGRDSIFSGMGDDYADGGDDDDQIFGDSGRDTLSGGSGDDMLAGEAGNDHLLGGIGNDKMYGGSGDDSIRGDSGNDVVFGMAGRDTLFGGTGDDSLYGGSDDDFLLGDLGSNLLRGNDGNDWLHGGSDNDRILGDSGSDDVIGGGGDDYLRGGSGADRMYGQSGRDDMDGEDGDDDLDGGPQSDRLRGGSGNDDYRSDSSDDVFDDSDDYSSDGDFEVRGAVSNLDTTAKTFTLLGLTINYASARVEGPLANGAFFKAEGTFTGGQVVAHEVERKNPGDSQDNFEARGTVSSLNTATRTFQFLGLTVNYNNAQVHGTLQDGANVKVEGNLAGSVVSAREVEIGFGQNTTQGTRNFELRAAISNLNTTDRTFSLLGITVSYSGAQVTTQLSNGAFVKVDGHYDGNRLLAREVEAENPDNNDENIEMIGAVQNLNTSARTFEMLGIVVDYSNARLDSPLSNGAVLEVEGWFANSTVVAERVR